MDDLTERARRYATTAHTQINHRRKYTSQPYDVHLQAVARRVASVSEDPAMVAAAWLHDTVEDTPATFEDIEREFGGDVAALVRDLTDISKPSDGNRAARKALDLQHLATVSPRAKTIKLADIIDNSLDICSHDSGFGRVYLGEARALLEVLREGDPRLLAEAEKSLAECELLLRQRPPTPATEPAEPPPWEHVLLAADQHAVRLFTDAFTARDVLEPLPSFDEAATGEPLRSEARRLGTPIVGVRSHGRITGYLLQEDLAAEAPAAARAFEPQQVVSLDTPLTDIVHALTHYACCFVSLRGSIVGVVTRADMEKPVVRMWLFGIIMLFEMLVVKDLRRRWPNERWAGLVSEGRLEKARALQEERQRRGIKAELLDCLQFSDKFQLMLREPSFLKQTGFASAAAAKKALKELESLRNDLAHGQDIAEHDWPPIVRLAHRIHQVLGAAGSR